MTKQIIKKILECGCVYETEINPQTGKSEEKIKLCPKTRRRTKRTNRKTENVF